ncbi:hypothetical protein B0H63DRAFT_527998 [Podospora didyma]|uniref:Uncharacterized protein n=1 Tax=Podospora didyma TaxID=330526 RepID=A0AAE0K5G4_9PEZI|nr:hypothetical protein B0H63DRAFT_527998 [Podospora didyma]
MNAPITSPMSQHTSALPSSQQSPTTIVPPPPPAMKSASTDSFLKDFTLVAEAAKRAQMACLMRDMESIGTGVGSTQRAKATTKRLDVGLSV